IHLGAQDIRQLPGLIDIPFRQALGWVQIGDYTDLAAVVGQTLAEYDARAVLHHTERHGAIEQHTPGRSPVGAIAAIDMTARKKKTVAAGQARAPSAQLNNVSEQPRDAGLAPTAGNADYGNPSGVAC